MKKIIFILKVILLSGMINLKSRMIYRLDFVVAIIIKSMETLISYLLLEFLLSNFKNIGGFTRAEMILLFGISELAFSVWHCFFINSLSIGYYIREGMIDRFLLRPVSPILQIILDGFDEDGWGGLIIALVLIGMAIYLGAGPNSFSGWLFLLFSTSCASLIYFSISLLLASTSFFAKTDTNLGLIIMDMRQLARYPLTLYPKWLRIILSTLVPLSICGYWPTLFLINPTIKPFLIICVTTILFIFFSIFIFNTALKKLYEGTGT